MNSHNGAKKLWAIIKIPGAVVACLIVIGTLGRWYMVYANSTAVTASTLKTHTKEITVLQNDYKGMYNMTRTMFVIDSVERAEKDPEFMEKVYAIMNNKDTIPDTLNTNEYLTTDLAKDSLE